MPLLFFSFSIKVEDEGSKYISYVDVEKHLKTEVNIRYNIEKTCYNIKAPKAAWCFFIKTLVHSSMGSEFLLPFILAAIVLLWGIIFIIYYAEAV
ncbi:MAG: hypothetical protein GY716_24455 [bacterium]|nr:hypothetical protein [bacterium]